MTGKPDLTNLASDQDPTALFWCWTENEPSTFRCRERGHDVRAFTQSTPVGISERSSRLSTSARLRSAELEIEGVREELTRQAAANEDLRATLAARSRALAASQADLTAMEADRDGVSAIADELRAELAAAQKPCAWKDLAVTAMRERDQARREATDG